MSHDTPRDAQQYPLEELAGDAMGALLQLALRQAKRQFGEEHALQSLYQVEQGLARLQVTVDIGGDDTKFVGVMVPATGEPHIVATLEIRRPTRPRLAWSN